MFTDYYHKYVDQLNQILSSLDLTKLEGLVEILADARLNDRQVFVIGNGGSAATASHMATDFTAPRFFKSGAGWKMLSLTDNMSVISARANDQGYENIFKEQLVPFLRSEDVLIAISASGNSKNVLVAVDYANSKGAETVAIVGFDGGELIRSAKRSIYIPTKKDEYGLMEDVSLIVNHVVSNYLFDQDRKQKK